MDQAVMKSSGSSVSLVRLFRPWIAVFMLVLLLVGCVPFREIHPECDRHFRPGRYSVGIPISCRSGDIESDLQASNVWSMGREWVFHAGVRRRKGDPILIFRREFDRCPQGVAEIINQALLPAIWGCPVTRQDGGWTQKGGDTILSEVSQPLRTGNAERGSDEKQEPVI
jgi:hypothetical protein